MAMTTNWIGWMLSVIVLLLLFATGAILQNPVRLLITGKKAEGVVVGMATSPGSIGQDFLQAPIFEFVTSTGDVVEVIYPPRRPDEGILNTWGELYPPPLFFGLMTLSFLVLFGLVLNGTIAPITSEPGSQRELKTSGVPASRSYGD